MDLSIGIAIWFAARGVAESKCPCPANPDRNSLNPLHGAESLSIIYPNNNDSYYESKAKILLVGMGADEQLGGYTRHRVAYQTGGFDALCDEIERQIMEIPNRNLGRDDRIISDHGREARFPFLDDTLLSYISRLPINLKCDLGLERGAGDKKIIRKIANLLGISKELAHLPKRAIQFGAKTAKMDNSNERGDFSLTS
jgi:asparagine synthetase B (glutamine-hydrolysing)